MSGLFPSLENFVKGTVATAAGLSTVGVGLLFFGQNYLIYPSAFPPGSRTEVPVPTDFGLTYQDLTLTTPDNVKIRCYLFIQRKHLSYQGVLPVRSTPDETDEEFASRRPTIIMFHGNGGNMGHRIPLARMFYVQMRCNVLMLSYRGYGLSEGNPSEKGIRIDAQCTLDYVTEHPTLSKTPIVLYGQSIGGAVAIDLASRNQHTIRALVLENTFLSLPRLVPTALPVLGPFAFLCHQKWDSASKIPLIPRETPMLLLSGVRDEVVPRDHMQGLWELVEKRTPGVHNKHAPLADTADVSRDETVELPTTGRSRYVEFQHGTHNDTCMQHGYWSAIADFLAKLEAGKRE